MTRPQVCSTAPAALTPVAAYPSQPAAPFSPAAVAPTTAASSRCPPLRRRWCHRRRPGRSAADAARKPTVRAAPTRGRYAQRHRHPVRRPAGTMASGTCRRQRAWRPPLPARSPGCACAAAAACRGNRPRQDPSYPRRPSRRSQQLLSAAAGGRGRRGPAIQLRVADRFRFPQMRQSTQPPGNRRRSRNQPGLRSCGFVKTVWRPSLLTAGLIRGNPAGPATGPRRGEHPLLQLLPGACVSR